MLHPIIGAVSAAVMITLLSISFGEMPNPGVVAGIMLIGVGVGLVVARYGNMGPFQGEFGSPWFEADLSNLMRKEVARAARFERDLSIAIIKQQAGEQIDWSSHIREADDVFHCRNGWQILVLPETPKASVQMLIERVTAGSDARVQAIIMDPSIAYLDQKRLGEAVLRLIRNPPADAEAPVVVRRDTDRLRWPAS